MRIVKLGGITTKMTEPTKKRETPNDQGPNGKPLAASVHRFVICPFCGTNRQRAMIDGQFRRYVLCDCGAEGPRCNFDQGDEGAIRKWNRRYDGKYGIPAIELHRMILQSVLDLWHLSGREMPDWLIHTDGRPLEQTIAMVFHHLNLDSEDR